MPTPLVTQHYPDDFQTATQILGLPTSGQVFLYADRDLVIDSITVAVTAAGSTGCTVKFAKTTSGTASSPVSPAAASITGGTDITGTQAATAAGTFNVALTSTSTDNNRILAGNWLGIVLGGTTTGLAVTVQVRFRSRLA